MKQRPNIGETRIKLSFAWFPTKTIDNGWIWFYPYFSEQKYDTYYYVVPEAPGNPYISSKWFTIVKRCNMAS